MGGDQDMSALASLPEHVAQRVIARAIELDTDGASSMPIARLRDIALEAGITAQSLERALTELLAGAQSQLAVVPRRRMSYLRRLGQRLLGLSTTIDCEPEPELWSIRGGLEAACTNLLAFFIFWVPTLLSLSFLHSLGYFRTGVASDASVLVATVVGIAVARRLRARLTLGILSLCAVGITIAIVSGLVKASHATGFFSSNAFGWLLSATLGIGVGLLLARFRWSVPGAPSGAHSVAGERPTTSPPADETTASGSPFLMLRLQRAWSGAV